MSFRDTAKSGLWQIFQLSIFVLGREKCHYQSRWIRNFRFFPSYFGFSTASTKLWKSMSVSDTDFLVFKQPLSEKILTNNHGLRMVRASPFIHQPDRVARKASDVLAADWLYQRHVKKHRIFFTCIVWAFLRAGNPCITLQSIWLNTFFNSYF